MNSHDSRRFGGALPFYLALVLVHVLSGLPMEQPLILADELGYLGNGRYLAGVAELPDMRGSQFYHFGYSLLLMPAFWLFSEPTVIYRAVVVINALLVSGLYFPLAYILTAFLQVRRRWARWIALVCCLYPSLILYSSLAWSENAFTPLFAVMVALFGRYLLFRSTRGLLLFGLVAGFLYTVHPRALPVLASILAYLLLLAILRIVSLRHLLLGVAVPTTVLLLTRVVNEHLKAEGWAGDGEVSAAKLAVRLVPDADFPALVERALGQLLYLTIATHGLFLLGVAAMICLVVRGVSRGSLRRALGEARTGVPPFILVTTAGIFAAACTLKLYSLHGPRGVRGADFIHGRYNETLAVLALVFALAELSRTRPAGRQLIWRVALAVVVTLALSTIVMAEVEDALQRQTAGKPGAVARQVVRPSDVDAIAVPGVYPWVGLMGSLDLRLISLAAMAMLLLVVTAMRASRAAGLALLALLFGLFAYSNHRSYLLWRVAIAEPRLALAAAVHRLGPFATIGYDAALPEPALAAGLQYLLPESVFERFDSRAGDEPGAEAVIAAIDWPQAERLDARFVIASGRGGALWLLPGEAQSRLRAADYLGLDIGARARADLRQSGFYRTEIFDGEPGRWTNGAATLTVPVNPLDPPVQLEIETLAPGPEETRLLVLANGVRLWNRKLPREFRRKFGLRKVPLGDELRLELRTGTFSPAAVNPSSGDRRTLGIVVKTIRLYGRQRPRLKK